MRTTYIDSNVLSDVAQRRRRLLAAPGGEDVRRDLCSAATKRTIAIGQWLITELADLECQDDRRTDFLADVTFLEQLRSAHILRPPGEMKRLEVQGFLRGLEINPVGYTELPRGLAGDRQLWARERAHGAELKTGYLEWEDGANRDIAAEYEDGDERAQRLTEEWTADAHGIAARWIREQMGVQREFLGLPENEALWPPPEKLPTFWCDWAYRLTRDIGRAMSPVIKKRKGSERKGSHAIDWGHYMCAAHADEFVTSDDGFLRIARDAPGPKPQILSLEEWVARLRAE